MKRKMLIAFMFLVGALLLSACGGGGTNPTSRPLANPSAPTTAARNQPAPNPSTRASPPASSPVEENNLPAWWPKELAMPPGTVYKSDEMRIALWENSDPNRDGIAAFLVNEGKAAGYNVYEIKHIYQDIYFFRSDKAYYVGVLESQITGNEIGAIHVKTVGALSTEFDVPVGSIDAASGTVVHGDSFDLRGLMRLVPNKDSNTAFSLFVEPYAGPGTFKSAQAEVIPGAPPTKEDYKSGSCTVVVKDDTNGTFDCKGMQNVYDSSKRLDVSGAWRLPLVSAVRAAPTAGSEPTEAPAATAAPVKVARLTYQENLSGAAALAVSFSVDAQTPECGVLSSGLFATGVTIQGGGHQLLLRAAPTAMGLLIPESGRYPFDNDSGAGVFLDSLANGWAFVAGSSGALTLNDDGSGEFAFKDFADAQGKPESGTIAWTCSQ